MKLKNIIRHELMRPINALMRLKYDFEKRNILKVKLQGGLCNKLLCLFAACEIAQKYNFQLLEPEFGWHKKILFSDIYDIDFFNQQLAKHVGGRDIMVARNTVSNEKLHNRIRKDQFNLWQWSEKNWQFIRKNIELDANSMIIHTLSALKLRSEYDSIVTQHANSPLAVQFRIESDWVKYSKRKTVENNEILLIDPQQLIEMLKDFQVDTLFFTTGENQPYIQSLLTDNGINASFFYNADLEYEINAAINFEILTQAQKFIGLSRSSFSNLITLKRQLFENNPENYVYNHGNTITKRVDFGVYPAAKDSVSLIPKVINDK